MNLLFRFYDLFRINFLDEKIKRSEGPNMASAITRSKNNLTKMNLYFIAKT